LAAPLAGRAETAPPNEIIAKMLPRQEGFWRSCAQPAENVSSRDLFAYALELCAARHNPVQLFRIRHDQARSQPWQKPDYARGFPLSSVP
jgi:hypothetical protein